MEPFALQTFWGLYAAELLRNLDSSGEGLSQTEATRRYRNGIMLWFRFVYSMRTITPLILGMACTIRTQRFILSKGFPGHSDP